MEGWIGDLITSLIVGGLTGLATVQFGLRRFRQERWWEKRYDAYATLISSVGEIHIVLSNERVRKEQPHAPSRLHELPDLARNVMRTHYMCGLLMSRRTNDLVTKLAPRLLAAGDDIDKMLSVTNDVIQQANEIARNDLELPRFK